MLPQGILLIWPDWPQWILFGLITLIAAGCRTWMNKKTISLPVFIGSPWNFPDIISTVGKCFLQNFNVLYWLRRYRKTPSKGRTSSINRTPTFEFWAGHRSPDYEILKASYIGCTLTFAMSTDLPAGQLAGMVNRPILTAHKPATCGRQTSNRSMRPETQWGNYTNIDNKDKCQGNNSFSLC